MLFYLKTTNFLAQNVAPRNFTAEFGTVPFAFDTYAPAIVQVNIYDSTGTNLVWNTSVTNNAAGTCHPSWNLTYNNGQPVPLPNSNGGNPVTYQVVVNATPLAGKASLSKGESSAAEAGGGSASSMFLITIQPDPYAGHTATFRNNHFILFDFLNTQENTVVSGTMGAVLGAYPIYPSDPSGYDRGLNPNCLPYVIAYDAQAPFFYNVLTNQGTGQFQYLCHANEDAFGCAKDDTASYVFHGADVVSALGTTLSEDPAVGDKYGHRVRLANLGACHSGAGKLNRDFGEPDGNQPGMSQASFVGWIIYYIENPLGPSAASPQEMAEEYWWSYWTNGGFDGGPGVFYANMTVVNSIPVLIPNPWRSTANFQWGRIYGIHGSKLMPWQKKD
jgi:hypothetical protein